MYRKAFSATPLHLHLFLMASLLRFHSRPRHWPKYINPARYMLSRAQFQTVVVLCYTSDEADAHCSSTSACALGRSKQAGNGHEPVARVQCAMCIPEASCEPAAYLSKESQDSETSRRHGRAPVEVRPAVGGRRSGSRGARPAAAPASALL